MTTPRLRRDRPSHQGRAIRTNAQPLYVLPSQSEQTLWDYSASPLASNDAFYKPSPFEFSSVRDDPPANDDEELGPFSIGSPSSPILSPCNSDELLSPPSYPHSNAILDGRPHDWKTDIPDVGIAPMKIFSAPSYEMPVDDDQDMTYEPNYHPPSGGKVRSPHRKAIEEKSSMKRKQAEQRLSQIITRRLGGTFVPGLANQLNHAAELLEKDDKKIRDLEEENRRLRQHYQEVDVKVRQRLN